VAMLAANTQPQSLDANWRDLLLTRDDYSNAHAGQVSPLLRTTEGGPLAKPESTDWLWSFVGVALKRLSMGWDSGMGVGRLRGAVSCP
ncbi:MAG TPA: hypothetical protein VIY28_05715, partial [Pseudonocardiaceae bacterium]